jgi:purine-binding chemotaxis protein CheW
MSGQRRPTPHPSRAVRREVADDLGPAPGSELLVFRAGPERFALSVSAVEAVIEMPRLQPLPGMPAGMLGVAQLRGTLVPVYSPARVLNVPVEGAHAAIIARVGAGGTATAARRVAIAVTAVEGVTAYEPTAWSGVDGSTSAAGLVRGVATWDGQLTTLVDAEIFIAACMAGSSQEQA